MDPRLEDFRNFLYLVWKHLNLPEPTPVQYDIAVYLQTGPKRMVIEAFRGVGKSWVTSALVCHFLLLNPQLNILVVSASKNRSDDFSTFTKRLINEMPQLAHLRARSGQRDSNIAFDVGPARASHAPSVKSLGITSQIAGSRADVIIADDIEVPNNSMTQMMRDKLSEAVKEFDAVMKPDGRIIYLGTPQQEQSLYNELPNRGYQVRIWPALYPTEKQIENYAGKLAPMILDAIARDKSLEGKPTDPQRFSDRDLLERELSYGRSGFNLQFMLDTTLSDQERYPLKLRDLIVMPLDIKLAPAKVAWAGSAEYIVNDLPNVGMAGDRFYRPAFKSSDFFDYTGSVMFIDPSGRGKDETSYAVVKLLNGLLYLTDAGGFKDGYSDDTLKGLALIAGTQKVNRVLVESNFGDGMFSKLFTPVLTRVHPCTIEEVHSVGQKELRVIDTLEPVLNQHRLVVDEALIKRDYEKIPPGERGFQYRLFYQLTRITKDRGSLGQDDRIEAVAGAVKYWVEHMARDIDQAVSDQKAEWLKDELRRFEDHAFGREGRTTSYKWF